MPLVANASDTSLPNFLQLHAILRVTAINPGFGAKRVGEVSDVASRDQLGGTKNPGTSFDRNPVLRILGGLDKGCVGE